VAMDFDAWLRVVMIASTVLILVELEKLLFRQNAKAKARYATDTV